MFGKKKGIISLSESQVLEFMNICYFVWWLGAFSSILSKNLEKITANESHENFDQIDPLKKQLVVILILDWNIFSLNP